MERFLINDSIHVYASLFDNMKYIILYSHGFGESKECINRHAKYLKEHNIGIIGYDFPAHGEDEKVFKEFNYNNCLSYICEVKKYLDDNYKDIPVCFMGCSFGGYMTLNYLNTYGGNYKVILNYPGINFCDVIIKKMNFALSYFDNHDSLFDVKTGYTLYKDNFFGFYNHDVRLNFNKDQNDFYIMHGEDDHTVTLDVVKDFCDKYDIELKVFPGERHGLLNSLDLVNQEIVNFINKNRK